MKIDGSYTSLVQGVSEQPPKNRKAGQCTTKENMSADPVDGLKRRPPLRGTYCSFLQAFQVLDPIDAVPSIPGVPYSSITPAVEGSPGSPGSPEVPAHWDDNGWTLLEDCHDVDILVGILNGFACGTNAFFTKTSWDSSIDTPRSTGPGLPWEIQGFYDVSNPSVSFPTLANGRKGKRWQIDSEEEPEIPFFVPFQEAIPEVPEVVGSPAIPVSSFGRIYDNVFFLDFGLGHQYAMTVSGGGATGFIRLDPQAIYDIKELQPGTTTVQAVRQYLAHPDIIPTLMDEETIAHNNSLKTEVTPFTVGNEVYIVNHLKKPAMAETLSSYAQAGSLLTALGGRAGATYTIQVTINNLTTVSATMVANNNASGHELSPKNMIDTLRDRLLENSTFTAVGNLQRLSDEVLHIRPNTGGQPITVKLVAGVGDLEVCNHSVKDVSNLPKVAPNNYFVTVESDGSTDVDKYYVKFVADASGNGHGIWKETVAEGIPHLIDSSTMPVKITYNPETLTFTADDAEWKGRQVGDIESNPDPSFIGEYINDIGYFQGRLVFTAGNSVIMSRTNRLSNFWISSATTQTDSDVIDIQSTAEGSPKMHYIIPYNRDLAIFAQKAQFLVLGRNSLTPQNASLILTTGYDTNLAVRPRVSGDEILFTSNVAGGSTGVWAFAPNADTSDSNTARNLIEHAPDYLTDGVASIAPTTSKNINFFTTPDTDSKKLYVYQDRRVGSKQVQAAWGTWSFAKKPAKIFVTQDNIWAINIDVQQADVYVSEWVSGLILDMSSLDKNFALDSTNPGDTSSYVDLGYKLHLDNMFYKSVTTGDTQLDFDNYSLVINDPEATLVVIQGEDGPNPGMTLPIEEYTPGDLFVTLSNPATFTGSVYIGVAYRSLFTPTMPLIKDSEGQVIEDRHLTVNDFSVDLLKSGPMSVTITSPYRPSATVNYSGYDVGSVFTNLGEPPISDRQDLVDFGDDPTESEITVFTASPYPLTISGLSWKGQYNKRGRRIPSGQTQ